MLTTRERTELLTLTTAAYEAHKRTARSLGKFVGYGFEDLWDFVVNHFSRPTCPVCNDPLQVASVRIGFKTPIERGGKFVFRNLEVSCGNCALCKGVLDAQEFRELWFVLRGWPKPVRKIFLARLRAGAKAVSAKLPALDSLEWFYDGPKMSE